MSLGDLGFTRTCIVYQNWAMEGSLGPGEARVYFSSTSDKNVFAIGIPFNK